MTAIESGGLICRTLSGNEEFPQECWWSIPVDAAPAMLAAFSRHLGAVEHPQQLRADYEFERARTTKLMDVVIDIARRD